MKTSIILLYYNHWDITHNRLYELSKHLPLDVEIILINNGSTDLDCETGAGWWQEYARHKIRYYKIEENQGFGYGMNIGAKIALKHGTELLVFLSNDVKIETNFLPDMFDRLSQDKNILLCGEIIWWDGGWNRIDFDGKKLIVPYGNGWLLACTSELWKKLGGFDPLYGKYDYEDIDVSTTATYLGYNIVALNNHKVQHLGALTIVDPERMEHTKENRRKYIEKWSDKFDTIFQRLEAKKNDSNKTAS